MFENLINSLNLPQRWKLRLIRHYSRKEYFDELLNRLDTSYDLDNEKIKIDYNRLEDLKKWMVIKLLVAEQLLRSLKDLKRKLKIQEIILTEVEVLKLLKIF